MGKKKASSFDMILFADVIVLSIFGLIMIFSASAPSAFTLYEDSFYFVKKQLLWTILGFGALFFCASFDYKKYKKWATVIYVLNIILLLAVLVAGTEVKGAKRWINLGFATFQPSEFVKIALVIYYAARFSDKRTQNITTDMKLQNEQKIKEKNFQRKQKKLTEGKNEK